MSNNLDYVRDVYNIDDDELYLKAEEGEFWKASCKFWVSVKDRKDFILSEKQKTWLKKIERSLNEENWK